MENLFDFTNYREHPTQKEYQVFHFVRKDQANFFENLLVEQKIGFERDDDPQEKGMVHYFAIKRSDLKVVEKLNDMAIGQYRNKFIPNTGFRWFVLIIGMVAISLAFIGYFKSR
ncbi:MAG: hypothetical protein ACPGEG_00930 [Salibacteraceae bacterium]